MTETDEFEEQLLHLMPGMTHEQAKAYVEKAPSYADVDDRPAADLLAPPSTDVVVNDDGNLARPSSATDTLEQSAAAGTVTVASTPQSRFELVFPSGVDSLMATLARHKVRPDERLVTQLLHFIGESID